MNKTILIPTDFTIESLQLVNSFLSKASGNDTFDIILIHGVHLTDSITELLFFSRNKQIEKLSNPEFEEACNIIKNKYASQINSLRKDIFSGINQNAFNNYVEANRIDEAYVPGNYKLSLSNKKSFDILPYIRKSNLKAEEIEWKVRKDFMPEKGKIAELFYNNSTANH